MRSHSNNIHGRVLRMFKGARHAHLTIRSNFPIKVQLKYDLTQSQTNTSVRRNSFWRSLPYQVLHHFLRKAKRLVTTRVNSWEIKAPYEVAEVKSNPYSHHRWLGLQAHVLKSAKENIASPTLCQVANREPPAQNQGEGLVVLLRTQNVNVHERMQLSTAST